MTQLRIEFFKEIKLKLTYKSQIDKAKLNNVKVPKSNT